MNKKRQKQKLQLALGIKDAIIYGGKRLNWTLDRVDNDLGKPSHTRVGEFFVVVSLLFVHAPLAIMSCTDIMHTVHL